MSSMDITAPALAEIKNFMRGVSSFVDDYLDPFAQMDEQYFEGLSGKSIADPLVGYTHLLPWEVALVDTRLFQRLRGISQLGLASLVYPSLTHDRFSHTMGVLARTNELIGRLKHVHSISKWKDSKVLDVLEEFLIPLRMAALFHDVGHCLFSHVSERALRELRGNSGYPSTKRIREVFSKILKKPKLIAPAEALSVGILVSNSMRAFMTKLPFEIRSKAKIQTWTSQAAYLIAGCPIPNRPDTMFLAQIISGGLDADKLDYMTREAYLANIPISVDFRRILDKIRVFRCKYQTIPEGLQPHFKTSKDSDVLVLGFSRGGQFAFEEFCMARVSLYDKIYLHQKVRAAEAATSRKLGKLQDLRDDLSELHRWLYLSEAGAAELNVEIPIQAERDLFNQEKVTYQHAGLKNTADRILLRRALAFGPSNSISDVMDRNVGQNQKNLPTLKLYGAIQKDEKFQDEIRSECLKISILLDLKINNTEELLGEVIVDLPEYSRVQQGLKSIYFERPVRLPIRWTLPVDKIVDYYLAGRALAYVFAPQEICAYVGLAAEMVLFRDFNLQYIQEGSVSEAVLRLQDEARSRLGDLGYYDNANSLKPVSEFLASPNAQEIIFEVVNNLRDFRSADGKQVSPASLTAFLMQFPNELQHCALGLCANLIVIDSNRIGRQVAEVISLYEKSHADKDLAVVPLGSMTDSANHLIYHWKNNSDNKIREVGPRVTVMSDEVVENADSILLFDDNINSGYQAYNIFCEWLGVDPKPEWNLNEHHVRPLGEPAQIKLRKMKLLFVFGVGPEESQDNLSEMLSTLGISRSNVTVHVEVKLLTDQRILSGSRSALEDAKRQAILVFLSKVGQEIMESEGKSAEVAKSRALGDSAREATVLFPYNVPTMTITAFWCEGRYSGGSWVPLIPRRRNKRPDGSFSGEDA